MRGLKGEHEADRGHGDGGDRDEAAFEEWRGSRNRTAKDKRVSDPGTWSLA